MTLRSLYSRMGGHTSFGHFLPNFARDNALFDTGPGKTRFG